MGMVEEEELFEEFEECTAECYGDMRCIEECYFDYLDKLDDFYDNDDDELLL